MPPNILDPEEEHVEISGDAERTPTDSPDLPSNHEAQQHTDYPSLEVHADAIDAPPIIYLPPMPPPNPAATTEKPGSPTPSATSDDDDDEDDDDDDPKTLGHTSSVHCLYGITTGSSRNPRLRWSDFEDARAEERHLMKHARSSAIIHRKVALEEPVDGRTWESHALEVQSPRLRAVLKRVLAGYPGLALDAPTLEFTPHYDAFVHRWQRLQAERAEQQQQQQQQQQNEDAATLQEIDLLVAELEPVIAEDRDALDRIASTGLIAWRNLWLIYPPGELVVAKGDTTTLFRLTYVQIWDQGDAGGPMGTSYWDLYFEQVDWDGRKFGHYLSSYRYQHFSGEHPVSKLEYCPLGLLPSGGADIKRKLVERGRKFEGLRGCHHKAYNGRKYTRDWDRATNSGPRELTKLFSGRVMVDALAYHQFEYAGGARCYISPFSGDDERPEETTSPDEPLTEEQLMISMPRAKGFDLKHNEWCEFDVDNISDIDFKEDAFQKLILPEGEKKMLKAFMDREGLQKCGWDDIIPGKGRGVIILLAGPPGVGKTLTAESVSEDEKVPLYTLRAGDMGANIIKAEARLQVALDCCKLWNAIFLIDEADVFLGSRSATSTVKQNELVSVFLRRLEYYQGLLFLTTNRYSSIDVAFRSRIDLILPFSPLDQPTRAAIWKTFVETVPEADCAITPADLEALSQHEFNGREIKNIVKTARLLAHSQNVRLGMQHLDLLLGMKQRITAAGQGV